jgi:uncharacterized surface protein with fasciclin (FAS1) repeats/subtilisin-like proprotein convertase family protein
MRQYYNLILAALLSFSGLFTSLNAQCPYNNTLYFSYNAPSVIGASVGNEECIFAGEFYRINNMQAGFTYRISTCGNIFQSFDTRITVYPAGGGSPLAFNDDFCGFRSQLDFTVPTTGSYDILIDETLPGNGCGSNLECAEIVITLISTDSDAYCTPIYTIGTANGDFINGVNLGSINNQNSGAQGGPSYSDFTNLSTNLQANTQYTLSITNNPNFGSIVAAWIDYNQDLTFSIDERLGQINLSPNGTGSIVFTTPSDPQLGATRLRVRQVFTAPFGGVDPCASATVGETEDYTVVLLDGTPPGPPTFNPSTACNVNIGIPDNSCPANAQATVTASNLGPLGSSFLIESVDVIITHPFVADLQLRLQAPSGAIVPLSINNGGNGANYGNPGGDCNTFTRFSMQSATSINSASAPFIGSFQPAGNLNDLNNGQSANGTWRLLVCDNFSGEEGIINYFRVNFVPFTNQVPTCNTTYNVTDGASGVALNTILTWGGATGIVTGNNIYFGTTPTAPLVASNVSGNSFDPGVLAPNTTYYFRAVPLNNNGEAENCEVISFTTQDDNLQDIIITNGTVTACSGNFYDSGGLNGNYGNDELLVFTIFPETAGQFVSVNFSSFELEDGFDVLFVFNGGDLNAPNIGIFTGNTNPGTLTSSAADGALTFVFISDEVNNAAGWAATISCVNEPAPSTVYDVIAASPVHNTLELLVNLAGLQGALQGPGPLTVFAPTDAAFNLLDPAVVAALVADPQGALTNVLLYHVVAGQALSTDLSDGQVIVTLNGQSVTVTINNGNVFINNAQVIVADILADNGVVHVIDAVLVPADEPEPTTVWDIIVDSDVHNTLESLVLLAGLDGALQGPGPLTVFAPTDAAFNLLDPAVVAALVADPQGALTNVLLYHVVAGQALSTDLSDGQVIVTLNGQSVTVTINNGNVFINNAQVIVADILADNGVVHVIDAVLVPADEPEPTTVWDIIVDSDVHNTLESLVLLAGLDGALQGPGPLTVFAPTDAAFNLLDPAVVAALVADPQGALTNVLLYHVVAGQALSTDLSDGQVIVTLNGQSVTVTISNGNVFINNAQVIVADILADNGVVHVIDAVLVPADEPMTEIIMQNGTFTTCDATFFDSGGPNGDYANGEDFTLTILPSQANSAVEVTFNTFNVEANWDALYVYDGPDTNSPLISSGNPATISGFPAGGFYGTTAPGPFLSSHPSGALTFVFLSDNIFGFAGWSANVTCVQIGVPPNCASNFSPADGSEAVNVNTTISWSSGGGIVTGYNVFFGTDPLELELVSENQTGTSFNPGQLELGTTYFYQIIAINQNGESSDCPIVSFTTDAILNINMFNGEITTCNANFFDSGGPSGNYSNQEFITLTIFPDQANSVIEVVFNSFATETSFDALYVYDGPSTASPQIASANGPGFVPGGVAGGFWGTTLIPGPFTSTHPTGALTFVFRSDVSVTFPGWSASISCIEAIDPPNCANIISPADGAENVSINTSITWSSGGGITEGYNIFFGTDPLELELAGTVTGTSFNPGTLQLGTTYFYQIVAFNEFGEALECEVVSFTTEQEQNINMQNGTFTTCNANFFDNGGPFANYSNAQNLTLTFFPDQPGGFVQVEFLSFATENNFDFLRVYDGNSTAAPLIGIFTGTNSPGTILSTASDGSLTFNFTSDNSVTAAGWAATVSCQFAINPPDCAINFSPADGAVNVNPATSISWASGGGIPSGYNVFFGTDPLGLQLVSAEQAATIFSPGLLEGNTTYFYQIIPVNDFGSAEDCPVISFTTAGEVNINMQNGTFTTCAGNFYDSGGPSGSYQNNENFTLTIFPSTPGAALEVNFQTFSTELNFDFLRIYDGNSVAAPLIGVFTGLAGPGTIVSTAADGSLTFNFTSDNIITAPGWFATISCIEPGQLPGCVINPVPADGAVNQSTTTILSWTTGGATTAYDVYFGTDANPPLVSANQIATTYNPGVLQPSTTYFWYVIPSNENGPNVTCEQVYSFTTSAFTDILMQNGTVTTCAANFFDSGGPGAPYQNNENFTLTIVPSDEENLLQVIFTAFNIESGWDFLSIYDGASIADPLIGTFTGLNSPGVVTSSTSAGLTFVFTSDFTITAPGWSAIVTCFNPDDAPNCPTFTAGPANGAEGVCLNEGVFTWINGGGIVDGYEIYFGLEGELEFVESTTVTTFDPGSLQANTTYQFQIIPFNQNGPNLDCDIITFTTGECVTYCDAGSTFPGCDEFISNVLMGDINNTTGCSQPGGYGDFTNLSTNVFIGSGESIIVSNGNPFAGDQLGIWVDWNQDGDFFDAGEQITVTGTPGVGPYSALITPPAGALLGPTRMRIRLTFVGAVDPCGFTTFGEVEDYTLIVNPELDCPFPNNLAATEITTTSSVLTWDPQPLAIQYAVRYKLVTDDVTVPTWATPAIVDAPTTSLFIQNLIVGGEYQFQVASICDPLEEPIFSSSTFFRTVCFECPEGANPENEVCGGTNNNGCNVTPSSFQDISCNETVCGTSTWNGTTRDTDWFRFTVSVPTVYTITAQAEFDYVLIFVNPNNCVNPAVITSGVFDACEEGQITTLLAPGTYSAFIAPTFEQPTFDCTSGGNTYYLTLSADVPPAIIFPVADLCETSAPVFLQGSPAGGTWSGVGITDPIFGEFDPTISGPGQFEITYTVEVNNCPSTATVTINVGSGAETPATPAGDTEVCAGTTQSTYTVEPVTGASSYVWVLTPTEAGTISGTSTTATVTWNTTYSGEASIVVAPVTGCGLGNFSNSLNIVVLPIPSAPVSVFGPIATCETSTQLIAVGAVGATLYNWSVSPEEAGTFSGLENVVNFITAPGFSGNVVISVFAVNACGQSDVTTFNMQVLPLPFADFVGLAAEYCDADGDVVLTGIPLGGVFSISDGVGITNNVFQPSIAGAGTYQITYTITVGNCTNTNTQSVIVNAGPVASFNTLPETICRQETPIQLVGTPEGGVFSGNGVVGNLFNPSVAGAGFHTVTYTFTESGNACPGVSSQTVEVLQGPVVTLGALSSTFCLNSATEILTGSPALGTFTINGVEATVFDPVAQGLGEHVVRYEIDNGTCIGFAEATVTVIENVNVAINGLGNGYCTNDSPVTLSSTPAGATFSGPGVVNNVFNPSSLPVGTYTITANYSDGNCTATVTQQVVINAEPTALFSYNANGFNVLFINNSINATSYSWDFGDGNSSTEVNPSHTYGQNGNYFVTLTATSENCGSDTYTAQVLLTVGIGEIEGLDGLQLYPNPTRNLFTLTFNSSRNENYEIRLTDAVGRLVHLENVSGASNFNKVYDMSDKADGVYFLTISSNKGAVNYKVVKQ